jgi:hypothetical protein
MQKFYISGENNSTCTIRLFTHENNNYIGQSIIDTIGSYEVVFELDALENIDVWAQSNDGESFSYTNITPLDGTGKSVDVEYEYTEIRGGNSSTY